MGPESDLIAECQHSRQHRHGSYLGYRCGCRCERCREAKRIYNKRHSVKRPRENDPRAVRAYTQELVASGLNTQVIARLAGLAPMTVRNILDGKRSASPTTAPRLLKVTVEGALAAGEQLIANAAPCRTHLQTMLDAGVTRKTLSRAAGCDWHTITAIVNGRDVISADLASSIMAVTWSDLNLTVGIQRRVQGLVAMGWPLDVVADRCGMTRPELQRLLNRIPNGHLGEPEAQTIKRVYRELWVSKPTRHGVTADQYEAARAYARTRGWVSGLAWDDDTIDRPDAEPSGVRTDKPVHVSEVIEDVTELAAWGCSWEQAAQRMSEPIAARSLERKLRRWGMYSLIRRLSANTAACAA